MGLVYDNSFTRGVRGKVSKDMVFRRYKGETVIYVNPRKTAPPTANQLVVQQKFKEGALYAKSVMTDVALKAEYQKAADERHTPIFQFALTDYLTAPTVTDVDLESYKGLVGNPIVIKAVDDYKVVEVAVEIQKADGSVVESGKAIQDATGISWTYTAKNANNALAGGKVKVTAIDKPGNKTSVELVLT